MKNAEASRRSPVLLLCLAVTLLCVILLAARSCSSGKGEEAQSEPVAAEQTPSPIERYEDSAEALSTAEWRSFRAGYDTDGSILADAIAGKSDLSDSARYELYLVYSEEMAQKLEEILQKYSLTLRQSVSFFYSPEELYASAELEPFLRDGENVSGFLYDDGSFHLDGRRLVTGAINAEYSIERIVRGGFSEDAFSPYCGEMSEVWEFTASDGTLLTLSQSEEESVVLASLPASFVILDIALGAAEADGARGFSREGLEKFADSFSFAALG